MMNVKMRSKLSIILLALFSFAFIAGPASASVDMCDFTGWNIYHLTAGRTMYSGDVIISSDSEMMTVQYITTDGWAFTAAHLEIQNSLADVPQTKNGGPVIGKFTFSSTPSQPQNEITFRIPLSLLPENDGTLIVVAHAVVTKNGVSQTAWGIDSCEARAIRSDFPGKNWASYVQYRLY
jgi:hypothetical protein